MPSFSTQSRNRLETCSEDLQRVFEEVVKHFDCTIVEGYRPQEKQDQYFREGKSRLRYPNGKYNGQPSQAVDVAPYLNREISWDTRHCLYFAGVVIGIASQMGLNLRWSGDWDMDNEPVTDQDFQDLVHFELHEG